MATAIRTETEIPTVTETESAKNKIILKQVSSAFLFCLIGASLKKADFKCKKLDRPIKNDIDGRGRGLHCTEVAFVLHTQLAWV